MQPRTAGAAARQAESNHQPATTAGKPSGSAERQRRQTSRTPCRDQRQRRGISCRNQGSPPTAAATSADGGNRRRTCHGSRAEPPAKRSGQHPNPDKISGGAYPAAENEHGSPAARATISAPAKPAEIRAAAAPEAPANHTGSTAHDRRRRSAPNPPPEAERQAGAPPEEQAREAAAAHILPPRHEPPAAEAPQRREICQRTAPKRKRRKPNHLPREIRRKRRRNFGKMILNYKQ